MKTKRLSASVPASYLDALKREAADLDMTVSAVVRLHLAEALRLDLYRLKPGPGSRPEKTTLADLM